jgi:hypothetical protein
MDAERIFGCPLDVPLPIAKSRCFWWNVVLPPDGLVSAEKVRPQVLSLRHLPRITQSTHAISMKYASGLSGPLAAKVVHRPPPGFGAAAVSQRGQQMRAAVPRASELRMESRPPWRSAILHRLQAEARPLAGPLGRVGWFARLLDGVRRHADADAGVGHVQADEAAVSDSPRRNGGADAKPQLISPRSSRTTCAIGLRPKLRPYRAQRVHPASFIPPQ